MTSSWWEIAIWARPSLEDVIFARLEKFGCRGTATEIKAKSIVVRAYLPESSAQVLDLAALALWLKQDAIALELPVPMVQWHSIDDEDWAISWKEHWQPQAVGDRLLIYPAWLDAPTESERIVLRLDPGVAFGTGQHPTTQLCLEALEMRLSVEAENLVLADIGCGSGILSLAAILLGAKQVYAVDIDPLATEATLRNSQLNNITQEQLLVQTGSIAQLQTAISGGVDGILCNILAEVIVDLIPHLNAIAKPRTWGIFSGLLLNQAKVISDVLEEHGWTVAALWKRGDWCCLNIRRALS